VIVLFQGFLVGRAVAALGERRLLACGLCMSATGFTLLCAAQSAWWVILGGFFIAGGNGLIMPSMSSLVSRNSTRDDQGTHAGFAQSAGALGRIVGPMLAGALFELIGPRAPMGSAATLVLIVCLMVLVRVHELRPDVGR
jgi:DHA1 family tetracycline resistance protein-like MFS transporter